MGHPRVHRSHPSQRTQRMGHPRVPTSHPSQRTRRMGHLKSLVRVLAVSKREGRGSGASETFHCVEQPFGREFLARTGISKTILNGEENGGFGTVGRANRSTEPLGSLGSGEEAGRAAWGFSGGGGSGGGSGGGRGSSRGRRADGVPGDSKGLRREQDQHHQGGARGYVAGSKGSQGPGRRGPQGDQGERDQG